MRALEAGNGRVDEEARSHRQKDGRKEGAGRRQAERGGAYRQVEIDRRLFRLLVFLQDIVKNLDQLAFVSMPVVVVNQDRIGQVVRCVTVDARHAHQLALDGLAKLALAMERWVVETYASARFMFHRP